MVPCSRPRTIAAPATLLPSIVMLLMTPITLAYRAVSILGLNKTRTSMLTGDSGTPSLCEGKSCTSVMMICVV